LPPSLPPSLPPHPQVTGVLRGFDQFMNIVLDETVDDGSPDKIDIGLVVIRGNSVVQFECLEKL
jgi:small nuclear ribonucleoprotein G